MGNYNEYKTIDSWPKKSEYVIFIDENNSDSNYKNIQKKKRNNQEVPIEEKYFTLTGCIISFPEYKMLKKRFNKLRYKYWDKGLYYNEKLKENKKVVFHSRDIRNSKLAFSKMENKDKFINELSLVIKETDFKIISVSINMENFEIKSSVEGIYETAVKFLIERSYKYLRGKTCSIIFESRGKKEDSNLLNNIDLLIDKNSTKITKENIYKKIKSIYFNKKYIDNYKKACHGLELTDLCSYPIYKYVSYGEKDVSYKLLENKIVGYPAYINKGLKIFLQKNKDE